MGYAPGRVWGVCDRCGLKRNVASLRKEWTGLWVCADDFDPRPPQLDPPQIYPEGLPVPNARPEPEDYELDTNEVTRDDL
jgi:hypothetical protein